MRHSAASPDCLNIDQTPFLMSTATLHSALLTYSAASLNSTVAKLLIFVYCCFTHGLNYSAGPPECLNHDVYCCSPT